MLLADEVATHHPVLSDNAYQPNLARIVRMREDGREIPRSSRCAFWMSTWFRSFRHQPGQFVMLSIPGTGEMPISISSRHTARGFGTVRAQGGPRHQRALAACGPTTWWACRRALRQRVSHAGDRRPRPAAGRRRPGHGAPALACSGMPWTIATSFNTPYPLCTAASGRGHALSRGTVGPGGPRRISTASSPSMRTRRARGRTTSACCPTMFDYARIDAARTYAAVCGPPVVYKFILKRLLDLGFPRTGFSCRSSGA